MNTMRAAFGCLATALMGVAVAQPVGLGVWDPFMAGPVGSTGIEGLDIDWWRGNAGQYNQYATATYTASGQTDCPIYQYGTASVGSTMRLTESQNVYGAKVKAGNAYSVYFAGTLKATPSSPGNVLIKQRGTDFSMGWNRTFDTGGDDVVTQIAIDTRGAQEFVYALGVSRLAGVNRWFLVKYSQGGAFQYSKVGENNSIPTGIAVDTSGTAYVAYTLTVGGVQQSRLVKFYQNGEQDWRTGYNPTTTANVSFVDIAVSGNQIFAVGYVSAGGSVLRPMMATFQNSGLRIAAQVQTTINGFFRKALPLYGGRYYAMGTQSSGGPGVITSFYEPSVSSTPIWNRKASPGATYSPSLIDGDLDPSGNAYFAANSARTGDVGTGMYYGKYNQSGAIQWTYNNFVAGEHRQTNGMVVHPESGQVWAMGRFYSGAQMIFRSALNQVATAGSPHYTMTRNTTLSAKLASADKFAQGATYEVVTAPAGGGLTLNADGSFLYTPATNFSGTRFFEYRITRPGVSASNVGRTTITVL